MIYSRLSTGCLFILLMVAVQSGYTQNDSVDQVAPGIYSFSPGDGYNSMYIVGLEGVVAIEPVDPAHAQGLLEAIKATTELPLKYLLHSHNHWDHSKGGQIFRDAGATIVAHKEAYDWMQANPHPDLALPDEYWNGLREDIKLGDTTIEMHYLGMSHGLGMTVFLLPEQKVIYIADVVTPKRVLFSIVPDFNINEMKRALAYIEALEFDKAVFSHSGGGNVVGDKTSVRETREFIEDLQAAIIDEFKKGTPFTQVPEAVKLPRYSDWAMYDEWLTLNAWRVMLDMHMGPFPWRPAPEFQD